MLKLVSNHISAITCCQGAINLPIGLQVHGVNTADFELATAARARL